MLTMNKTHVTSKGLERLLHIILLFTDDDDAKTNKPAYI